MNHRKFRDNSNGESGCDTIPKKDAGRLLELPIKHRGGYIPAGAQMGPKPIACHLVGTW